MVLQNSSDVRSRSRDCAIWVKRDSICLQLQNPPRNHQARGAANNAAMATKSKTMAPSVGSMPWLDQENRQVAQFAAQEAEDFVFSVRNELDFLNEHMAEIFSKNQVYDFCS